MNKCAYVLTPANGATGQKAVYCGKATSYAMKRDDDGNLYRCYEMFCPACKVKIEQQRIMNDIESESEL
jgi:hypothetical protein